MRFALTTLCVATALAGVTHAHADHQPGFVIPGRPDVPVIINGIDASFAVVEGDWGLYRPGAAPVTVIPPLDAPPRRYAPARPYFPSLGGRPYAGRHEIEPPADRVLPKPAPVFRRSWSAESMPVPPTEYTPTPSIYGNMPMDGSQQGGSADQNDNRRDSRRDSRRDGRDKRDRDRDRHTRNWRRDQWPRPRPPLVVLPVPRPLPPVPRPPRPQPH